MMGENKMSQDKDTKEEIKTDMTLAINNLMFMSERLEKFTSQQITNYLEVSKTQIESALKTAYQKLRN
jgi:hypothetical protein